MRTYTPLTKQPGHSQQVTDAVKKANSGSQVDTYQVDMSDSNAVDQFVKELLQKHGHVDVLVNNAGMMPTGHPFEGVILLFS
jgi:NAD(P)-dependent dehydrogenase (short-subunit alcohol dehydrogenase family)